MFFLAPALPYLGAGIAGLGAAARAAGSPQGQRFLQGGINTLNRFGTRLQDFLQPAGQMITQQAIQKPITAGSTIPFAIDETTNTISLHRASPIAFFIPLLDPLDLREIFTL